jgi:hypothetical protein
MIPDKPLISAELGVDLVAVGVERGGGREALCVLGGTADRAGEVADALEAGLAPDAREPRTGERMSKLVSAADVQNSTYEDVEVVRAELTLAAGQKPGFLFDAASRGSLVDLINGT